MRQNIFSCLLLLKQNCEICQLNKRGKRSWWVCIMARTGYYLSCWTVAKFTTVHRQADYAVENLYFNFAIPLLLKNVSGKSLYNCNWLNHGYGRVIIKGFTVSAPLQWHYWHNAKEREGKTYTNGRVTWTLRIQQLAALSPTLASFPFKEVDQSQGLCRWIVIWEFCWQYAKLRAFLLL